MPTSAPGSSIANSNGKRPLYTILNGDMEDVSAAGKAASVKTHAASGYAWSRAEDEPGWAWMNKKAVDEAHRAWEGLMQRERMVQNRYGDPFEVVEKEKAILASLKQQ